MTRLCGRHSTLRIHLWLPHGALNGSNGWTHNLEVGELANAFCGLRRNCREQRLAPEIRQALINAFTGAVEPNDVGYRLQRIKTGSLVSRCSTGALWPLPELLGSVLHRSKRMLMTRWIPTRYACPDYFR
jgi:hypothetical protein